MRKILNSKWLLLFLILTVAACSKNEIATPTAVLPLETETAVSNPTAIPSSTPVPTATNTPIPTPAVPMIDVADQPLTDDGELQIGNVIAPEDGWLVLYAMPEGELGDVLAFTAVSTGLNPNITVTIDPQQATPTLAALLHRDMGQSGEFEFPDGPDEPLEWESARIATIFSLDFQLSEPLIEVSAQAIGEEGLLQVDSVLLPEDGWLAIHAQENGRLTEPLGVVPLTTGLHENVVVAIPWREGTPTLVAILYVDNGRSLYFDYQAEDVPMQVNGEPLTVAFAASYPPDIFVLDQPLVNGTFEVERVISNGPGWLVAYFDDDGEPGLIIGSAPLADGLNEQVKVEVLQTAVTPILHLRLHEDNVPGDDFDFPRVDQPVFYEDRLPNTVTFSTTQGNYLIVEDQILSDSGSASAVLSVNLVVVDVPVWVAIEMDDNGKRGEILGFTAVSPGINRNVAISIDPALATETVYVSLYLNADEPDEFDPTNADVPLQRNRSPITVPFFLLEEQ